MLAATEHGGLMLGPEARAVLKGEAGVMMAEPPVRQRRGRRARSGGNDAPNPVGNPLFEALRAKRKDLASEHGIPAYVIYPDATLRELARRRPTTDMQILEVRGIGPAKARRFGAETLSVIRSSLPPAR